MTHAVAVALSGVWPFVVTNVDDFVLLTALFVTVGRGGPTNRQIVIGQYLGMGALVVVSLLAALGLVPIALGTRALLRVRRTAPDEVVAATVTGVAGVVMLTVADGADNVSVYIPLFRQAGAGATAAYMVVFAVLVGVWCTVARATAPACRNR